MSAENGQNWDACPPGTVTNLVSSLRSDRRPPLIKIALSVVAVLAIAAASSLAVNWSDSGAMTCSEVVPLLASYHSGDLSRKDRDRVSRHLDDCPACEAHYESIRTRPNTRRGDRHPLAVAIAFVLPK
ncbi:MAG: zf-HC2 domain-containing protein [Pirellulaceae bacterium]|nr:zf-HC2 domain-containing protein [Pirellulaceae bacterium]